MNRQTERLNKAIYRDQAGRLVLRVDALGLEAKKPFYIDWIEGDFRYRAERWQHELVVRAVLGKQRRVKSVIDLTAGLGRDGFILASQGLQVTLLERSEIIYQLLSDAIERASLVSDIAPTVDRISLLRGDANDLLSSSEWLSVYDLKSTAIYCDPMFPARTKSAKVKKEMQVFQAILDHDQDKKCVENSEKAEQNESSSQSLLASALKVGAEKVVIKRPSKSPYLIAKPTYSIEGKAVRFDVYQTQ